MGLKVDDLVLDQPDGEKNHNSSDSGEAIGICVERKLPNATMVLESRPVSNLSPVFAGDLTSIRRPLPDGKKLPVVIDHNGKALKVSDVVQKIDGAKAKIIGDNSTTEGSWTSWK